MGLRDAVERLFNSRAIDREMSATPFRRTVGAAISVNLAQTKLHEHFSKEARERIAGWLWGECIGIEQHEDPRGRCRYVLVDQTLARAQFEVLVMDPDAYDDPTGLIGTQGISGRLHSHIDEVFRVRPELRDATGLPLGDVNFQSAHDAAVIMMWKSYWISSVFNAARVALHDTAADDNRDWYKPFCHAAYVAQEQSYRQALGLESAIDDPFPEIVALAYHNFMEFALSDAPSPLAAWRSHYRDWLDEGRLRPPFGAD